MNFKISNPDSTDLVDFSNALRQAGADCVIQLYGNHLPNGMNSGMTLNQAASLKILDEISSQLFRTYLIEVMPVVRRGSNLEMVIYDLSSPNVYSNVHVNRQQAMSWLSGDARHEFEAKKKLRLSH